MAERPRMVSNWASVTELPTARVAPDETDQRPAVFQPEREPVEAMERAPAVMAALLDQVLVPVRRRVPAPALEKMPAPEIAPAKAVSEAELNWAVPPEMVNAPV